MADTREDKKTIWTIEARRQEALSGQAERSPKFDPFALARNGAMRSGQQSRSLIGT
jgi:hypothetical protein